MNSAEEFTQQLAEVRQTTRNLIESVMMDIPPRSAAVIDFGLDSPEHYEALYYPIREGEIMPRALDDALGDGAKLTALAAESPSNPHKDVRFSTSWDGILGREVPEDALPEATKLERTLERLAEGSGLRADLQGLAEEIRADEQAARVRDYGPEDAATYEQRVNEGAASMPRPEEQSSPVDPREMEAIAAETDRELQSGRHRESIERQIEELKGLPEIDLESTRRYIQHDPEDAGSIDDTCDTLGPWHTLNDWERLIALNELDWSGVSPEARKEIITREAVGSGNPIDHTEDQDRVMHGAARDGAADYQSTLKQSADTARNRPANDHAKDKSHDR